FARRSASPARVDSWFLLSHETLELIGMAMTARFPRQMTLTLSNHKYKSHTTCRGGLINLKKINLPSGCPSIGQIEVCVCGTRRSRFRKRGARHDQGSLKLMSNAFPIL